MKKLTLKLYDKIIVAILFSAFLLASCKPDEPIIVPMYGAPASTVSIHKVPPSHHHQLK